MTKLCLLLALLFPTSLVSADCPPQLEWQRFYGGNKTELMRSLVLTEGGGFLLAGVSTSDGDPKRSSQSFGANDFHATRIGPNGQKIWDKSFGGTGDDRLSVAKQTKDHGFILAGSSSSAPDGNKTSPNYGFFDYWIVRLNAAGHKIWEQSYGGDGLDLLYDLQETDDGGFILGGYSESGATGNKGVENFSTDIWIIRLDSQGRKVWERAIGRHRSFSVLYSIEKLRGGGFLLGGFLAGGAGSGNLTSQTHGGWDGLVAKLDDDGNVIWDRTFGGTGYTYFTSVRQAEDGGFFAAGWSDAGQSVDKMSPALGGYDAWVVRLDADGKKLWDKSLGGSHDDSCDNLLPSKDGSCYVVGSSYETEFANSSLHFSNGDGWFGKLAPDGELKWMLTLGGTNSYEFINEIAPTPDGGFLLGGSSDVHSNELTSDLNSVGLDFWVLKFGPDNGCDSDKGPRKDAWQKGPPSDR
jgi:hypothetical protein